MAFTATDAELQRYFVKASLGQATVTAVSEDDISLAYHRFDSDTGVRIADEVTPVDYHTIVANRDAAAALVVATQTQLNTLTVVVDYLNSLLV